jgi:cobalt/nickel transport system ATP-binding protein
MDNNSLIISLENICFGYPAYPKLLNNLNFILHQGDRIGIIGPNGCGKTTLFYIIMGLVKPQRGKIKIFNRERTSEKDFIEIRKKVGFLFQNSDDQLFCPSIREEVAFGPLNFGKKKQEVEDIVQNTLKRVGLVDFEQRVPYNLSGGEKRRLALATVLAMKPRVLLLDEPALGLDQETVEKIVGILEEQNLSYIVISQYKDFLKRITTVLYTIDNGQMKLIQR